MQRTIVASADATSNHTQNFLIQSLAGSHEAAPIKMTGDTKGIATNYRFTGLYESLNSQV